MIETVTRFFQYLWVTREVGLGTSNGKGGLKPREGAEQDQVQGSIWYKFCLASSDK